MRFVCARALVYAIRMRNRIGTARFGSQLSGRLVRRWTIGRRLADCVAITRLPVRWRAFRIVRSRLDCANLQLASTIAGQQVRSSRARQAPNLAKSRRSRRTQTASGVGGADRMWVSIALSRRSWFAARCSLLAAFCLLLAFGQLTRSQLRTRMQSSLAPGLS